jgi:hypothetical protein
MVMMRDLSFGGQEVVELHHRAAVEERGDEWRREMGIGQEERKERTEGIRRRDGGGKCCKW